MWFIIFFLMILGSILGYLYLVSKLSTLIVIKYSKLISFIILLVINFIISKVLSFTNAIVIIIHFVLGILLVDFIIFLINKFSNLEIKNYYSLIIGSILVIIYLLLGWRTAHNVVETTYDLNSDKIDNLKIVLFSDSHMGTTFDSEGFKKELDKISKVEPDIIIVAGDYVDDGSSKEDMIKASKYLGEVETKYGIYFVHGNHDKAYYGAKRRGYSGEDLENVLEENGIKVLKDESILVNDEFYIIGRKDAEDKNRLSMNDLVKDLDKDKYMIVVDHQPTDYENQAESEVDLVLSGHTHGGQLIPITYINTLVSENYRVYGHEKRNKTDFIVSSGISSWDIRFKTGCISEYVVINVKKD